MKLVDESRIQELLGSAEDRQWKRNSLWAWLGNRPWSSAYNKPWRRRVGNEHLHNYGCRTACRCSRAGQSQWRSSCFRSCSRTDEDCVGPALNGVTRLHALTGVLSVKAMLHQSLLTIAHFCEEGTLRTNEYGLRASSGSSGHPLPDEFAS